MRIEQHIATAWAGQLGDKLIKDSIATLEQMGANGMLSGDDSGLKNVWEEICVQVQHEESIFWAAYIETMEGLLAGFVELLDKDSHAALWAVTDKGLDYIDDHHTDDYAMANLPVSNDDIVTKLKDGLLSAAANYSNSSITKFLKGQEDGDDQFEEDEGDEDGDGDDDG